MRYLLEVDGANWEGQRRGRGEIKAMIYERIIFFQLISNTNNLKVYSWGQQRYGTVDLEERSQHLY